MDDTCHVTGQLHLIYGRHLSCNRTTTTLYVCGNLTEGRNILHNIPTFNRTCHGYSFLKCFIYYFVTVTQFGLKGLEQQIFELFYKSPFPPVSVLSINASVSSNTHLSYYTKPHFPHFLFIYFQVN